MLKNAVCAGCGCFCDDLTVRDGTTVSAVVRRDGGQGRPVEDVCALAGDWLESLGPVGLECTVEGSKVPFERALEAAARRLRSARAPAVFCSSALGLEAARETLELARTLRATFWPPAPTRPLRAGIDAVDGEITLGEVRSHADLFLLWHADPDRTHPRHLERLTPAADVGQSLERKLVVVRRPDADTLTARRAHDQIDIPPGFDAQLKTRGEADGAGAALADLAVLRALRRELVAPPQSHPSNGEGPTDTAIHPTTAAARRLAAHLSEAKHTHVFLGVQAAAATGLWNAWQALAADLRCAHRISVSSLPQSGNGRGLEDAMLWSVGRPWAVAFHPEGVEDLGEMAPPLGGAGTNAWDVAVCAGIEPTELPRRTRGALAAQPRIIVAARGTEEGEVSFRVPGLDPRLRATVVREDGVHLTLCGGSNRGVQDPAVTALTRLRELLTT